MRSIEKTAADLFQKLRARYTPVTLGNESAESTSDPAEARFFNFVYSENDKSKGPITISLVDNRAMKVFFSDDIVDRIEDKNQWYAFLRELRNFAKRNLLMFDARDIAKSQLDTRDFGWLSKVDGTMDQSDITVSESTMWGSKRRSYQALESVKMIVQHSKSVDETVPGARSRSIQAIYLERNDGERYKFPYNYLTGARAMARHITEGGTPYDPLGQHILGTIKEMRDLSKFARMTKTHALEDGSANEVRQRVVERFRGLKSTLGALSGTAGYTQFKESFQPPINEQEGQNLEDLRERFTRKIWDNKMEELLPAVVRALESAEITEASGSVENQIKDMNRLIVLKRDPNADAMIRNTKFTNTTGLMGFVLSDIATRAIGDDMDALANFAADVAERIGDSVLDPKDKQLGMFLAKRYIDDIKKMATDPEYADMIRKDPNEVYGKKKKRSGGFHEAETFENWVNAVDENEDEDEEEQNVEEAGFNDDGSYNTSDDEANEFDDYEADAEEDDDVDEVSPVYGAIIHRIIRQHPAMLGQHGPEKVMDAVQEVADFVGDVEEIGSSDISGWVRHVEQMLSNMSESKLDELSPELLGRYANRATKDASANMKKVAGAKDRYTGRQFQGHANKREKGADMAIDKIRGNYNVKVHAKEDSINELQALSGITRVDPRDPNAITKTALAQKGITTGSDPKTGAMTVGKGVNKQQVLAILKGVTAKSKGKINPAVVMNDQPNQGKPVMEKEIRVNSDQDQDSDGDTDFADVMIARKVKSGQPKDKAIASTRDKSYNEVDMHESTIVGDSIALLKKLSGL